MTILEQEANAGFPRMRGARFQASVPIIQQLVDGWLRKLPVQVAIQDRNRLLISYSGVNIPADIVAVTPALDVVLSTPWWSRAALWGVLTWKPALQKYLQRRDKFIVIVCGEIPAVARYAHLWRHVSDVRARTEPGRLWLDIQAVIS